MLEINYQSMDQKPAVIKTKEETAERFCYPSVNFHVEICYIINNDFSHNEQIITVAFI